MEAYRVGVNIALSSNSGAVLGVLARELLGVHGNVKKLTGELERIRPLLIGAGSVFVGGMILHGMWDMVKAAGALNRELERTKQLGGDFAASIDQTRKAAFGASFSVPTTTPADNVRMARELATTIGHPDQADNILPDAAKTAYVVSHYTGENVEEIIKNLARTADARGQIYSKDAAGKERVDPVRLRAEMDAAAKALILGGGFIKSSDLLQMARQGGAAVKGQTPEAFYAAGVEAGIAMGASKLGTAETGLYQQFIGGTMTKKIAEHLTEAGLLHPNDWRTVRGGGVIVSPQATKRFQPMMSDPIAWLTTGEGSAAIKRYAAKEGIDTMMAIFQLFGRQTVQRLVSEATSNQPQFERAREIYGNIPSVAQQYKELQAADLDTNIKSFQAAWEGLMQSLGDKGIPVAIGVLHALTDAIHYLTSLSESHPLGAEFALGFVGVAASAMVVGGALQVIAFALGPFTAAIRLLMGVTAAGDVAAAGATAMAGGVRMLSGALSLSVIGGAVAGALALAGAIAAIAGILKLGSDYETPENRKRLDDLSRARRAPTPLDQMSPQDGFDAMGRPVQKQSYVAPANSSSPRTQDIGYSPRSGVNESYVPPTNRASGDTVINFNVDGKVMQTAVIQGLARESQRPPTTTNSADSRLSLTYAT